MARCKSPALYAFDRLFATGPSGCCIVGIDEVGRGPLAGPVVTAAVVLDLSDEITGINDSKKLTAEKRDELYDAIVARARAWQVGVATTHEIAEHNILQATFIAMQRALDGVTVDWALALVDGNQLLPTLSEDRQQTIVGGDAQSASIAAASIVAKVARDRMMAAYHEQYPHYGFDRHKGYGTADHIQAIREHGLCPIHRPSFCSSLMAEQLSLAM